MSYLKKILYTIGIATILIPTFAWALPTAWDRYVIGGIRPLVTTDHVLVGGSATTTNANLEVIGSFAIGSSTAGCLTLSNVGIVYSTGIACGSGSGGFPFTPTTNFAVNTSATGTPLWLRGSPISLMASSTSAFDQIKVFSTTATSSITNLGGVLDPNGFTGADIGAKINTGYNSSPSYGVNVLVPAATSSTKYVYSTGINFNTLNKPARLGCSFGGGASNSAINGTILNFNASSGTSTAFNTNSYVTAAGSGIVNCNLQGPNGASNQNTDGVFFGGTNGAFSGYLDGAHINGFGTGVVFKPNTSFNTISNSVINFNGRNINEPDTSGANCEQMRIINSVIADSNNVAGGVSDLNGFYVQESGNCQWSILASSIDDNQIYVDQFGGTSNIWNDIANHKENPDSNVYNMVQSNPGSTAVVYNLLGGDTMNDVIAGQPQAMLMSGTVNLIAHTVGSNSNVTGPTTRIVNAQASSTRVNWIGLECKGAGATYVYGRVPCGPFGIGSDYGAPSLVVASSSVANGIGNVGVATNTPGTIFSIGGQGTGVNFVDNGTTTFSAKGLNLIGGGCYAINGTCIGGGGGSGTVGSGTTGQLPYYAANGTALTATSTLFLNSTGSFGIGPGVPVGRLQAFTLTDTNDPGGVSAYDNEFALFGPGQNDAVAISKTANGRGYITSLRPGSAWDSLGFQASDFGFYLSGGTSAGAVLNGTGFAYGSTSPGTVLGFGGNGIGANFTIGTSTFSTTGGINLKAGCFSVAGTCIGSGAGSGTVTNITGGYGIHGGPITTTGTLSGSMYATFVVSTTTTAGDFTDVQSAINRLPSTGGLIHVTCGTYTLPSGNVGIQPKVANTVIEGEGNCTQFNFDRANTTNAYEPANSNLTGLQLRDVYIHQTNGTFGGIGINASNTPLFIAQRIKIDQTATSTSIKDTQNLSFYQTWENLDLRDNTSCIDIGGLPVNDNTFKDVRCAMHSGNKGFALYLQSSSANGAQNNTFINFNSEPTGAATGLTAIYADNAVDNTFIGAYVEGNAVAWNFTANSQRNTFTGGEFVTNTTYTNNGSNNQWLGVDKEFLAYNLIMASSTIADVSGGDAAVPSLSFIGNTNFAKISNAINILFANNTDSGVPLKITNPGTGTTTQIQGTGTGYGFEVDDATNDTTPFVVDAAGNVGVASSTPRATLGVGGTVMAQLTTFATGDSAVCQRGTGGLLTTDVGVSSCIVSSKFVKKNIQDDTVEGARARLAKLNPVTFNYIDNNQADIGLIAEEAAKVDKRYAQYATSPRDMDGHHYNVGDPVAINWSAIQADMLKVQQADAVGVPQNNWKWYLIIGVFALWNIGLTIRRKK